jgi:hypothetical protein
MRQGILALLTVSALGLWGRSAWALSDSDKEAVRALSNQAAQEFNQNQFEAARGKFLSAYLIARVPRLAVWEARAEEKLGHLVAAYEMYRQALSLQPNELWQGDLQQQAQRDAQQELDALLPRMPRVTIAVEGATPEAVAVNIDDVAVPSALVGLERLIDPGQHTIAGKRGDDLVSETVQIAERDKKHVVLRFGPGAMVGPGQPSPAGSDGSVPNQTQQATLARGNASSAPDSSSKRDDTLRTAGWVALGVGAAGVALGAITGIYVAAKHGDLSDQCPINNTCDQSLESQVNTYHTMRTLSTVGFIVGGIGAAAGVTLLLTTPKSESKANVALLLTPGMASVQGAF